MDESMETTAHNRLERLPDQRRELGVAVEDVAAGREDERAFLHLLDQPAVGLVGAVQRVDLTAVGALDDQCVDLALTDRAQHFFGLGEAGAQRVDLVAMLTFACHRPAQGSERDPAPAALAPGSTYRR